MKKAIFRNYIFIMITTILFLGIAFFYFTIKDIAKIEKKEILNTIKNIDKYEYDTNENYEILKVNDITIIITDDKGNIYATTEKNEENTKALSKVLIKKFLKNENKNFYYYKNKICYINYLPNKHKYIVAYKNFYLIELVLFNILFSTILVSILLFIIIHYMVKKFNKDVIFPINKVYTEIIKIQSNIEKLTFEESKFEEINHIYKAINLIKDKTKNIFYDIKTQNNKIEYILDNTNEGFLLFNKNREVFTINKVARKVLGCVYEGLGNNIIYYTQNMKIIESIEKLFNERKKSIFDIKTEDNKIYSVYISQIEECSFENEYTGGIMILMDITAEREKEILKQEFFSNISHELKTPITSIQGYAELLYNDFATTKEQEKEFLKRIQKESQNITNLINNILTISKLENKFIEINKTNIEISSIVSEIIETTKPLCLKNNIQIFNKCEKTEIFADYKMIHQLLNNLIVNAIKYNKKNGSVEIKCTEDNKYINLTIKDTGIGIPLADKNRIFERFYRVEKGRTRSLGGSGLGLSIVKHILNYYNGTIKLKTKENVGTEFFIKIPKN